MATNIYGFIDLYGGGDGALDEIDGTLLAHGDMAFGVLDNLFYTYFLDSASGADEDIPNIIKPDINSEDKRWILKKTINQKISGAIDCSTNPDYPAADAGDIYIVSVPGRIGGDEGKEVEYLDMIYCTEDDTPVGDESEVGDHWVWISGEGYRGADGAQGADGIDGTDGAQGPQGAQGAQGFQGMSLVPRGEWEGTAYYAIGNIVTYLGVTYYALQSHIANESVNRPSDGSEWEDYWSVLSGAVGPTGAEGPQGPQGITGVQGVQGPAGDTGPQGAPGITGTQGLQGEAGEAGPQGEPGLTGPQGEQGPAGPAGPEGPEGLQGVQGLQGPVGDTGPQGPPGITGQQGPQGVQGETGVQGPTGVTGSQGPVGVTGDQGLEGAQGDDGAQGPQGYQGYQGAAGVQGSQGNQGNQGFQGDDGPQGPQGTQGFQGQAIIVSGTVATAIATSAKTCTIADYTPTAGDQIAITFSNGNTAAAPTLNINGTGAYNIKLGGTNASAVTFTLPANSTVVLYFTGTSYNMGGSHRLSDSDAQTNVVQMQLAAPTESVTTGHLNYFMIPDAMNGKNLIRAEAATITAGTSGATTVQVRNMTKYASNDALSGAISIASAGTVGTVGTVNTSYDDVATNDIIKIYVTGVSTTAPKGLIVILEYN